ncbi:hypothetical protein [Bacillus sp. FJAT-27916]
MEREKVFDGIPCEWAKPNIKHVPLTGNDHLLLERCVRMKGTGKNLPLI